MNAAAVLAAALALDALLGEPRWLWSRLPHPAVLMGRLIGRLEARLNRGTARQRQQRGALALALLVAAAAGAGLALRALPGGPLPEILALAILLAQRALADHVRAVAAALRRSLAAGRREVGRIVGRDTATLAPEGVARAAIESAAENFSDGVVAPAFWFLLLGLPGLLVCKAVNTADSMIGHLTPRYRDFGRASARLDDLVNWIPARLSALLIALANPRRGALATIRRDAPLHRSPNAGWPEAAMAHALGVALAGPRSYGGAVRDDPWLNPAGRRRIGPAEIGQAAAALWRSWALLLGLLLLAAAL